MLAWSAVLRLARPFPADASAFQMTGPALGPGQTDKSCGKCRGENGTVFRAQVQGIPVVSRRFLLGMQIVLMLRIFGNVEVRKSPEVSQTVPCNAMLARPVYNEYPLGATSVPLLLRSSPCSHISRACIKRE